MINILQIYVIVNSYELPFHKIMQQFTKEYIEQNLFQTKLPTFLTGAQLNKMYPTRDLYTTVKNTDDVEIDPSKPCVFMPTCNLFSVFGNGNFLRKVTVSTESKIYSIGGAYYSYNLALGDPLPIESLDGWKESKFCNIAVTVNGLSLRFVKNKTYEIQMAALKQNGLALQYVTWDTLSTGQIYELMKIALQQNIDAFELIPDKVLSMFATIGQETKQPIVDSRIRQTIVNPKIKQTADTDLDNPRAKRSRMCNIA